MNNTLCSLSGKHSPDDEFGCSCGRTLLSLSPTANDKGSHVRHKMAAAAASAASHVHAAIARRPSPLVQSFQSFLSSSTASTSTSAAITNASSPSNPQEHLPGFPQGVGGSASGAGSAAGLHIRLHSPPSPPHRYPNHFLQKSFSGSSPATRSHSPARSPTAARPATMHRLSAHANSSFVHAQKSSPHSHAHAHLHSPSASPAATSSSTLTASTSHMIPRGTARERVRRAKTERQTSTMNPLSFGVAAKARRSLKHILMKTVPSSGSSASVTPAQSVSRSRLASSEAEPEPEPEHDAYGDCDGEVEAEMGAGITAERGWAGQRGRKSRQIGMGWSRDGSVDRSSARASSTTSIARRHISAERGWLHTLNHAAAGTGIGQYSLRRTQSSRAKDRNSSSRTRWESKHNSSHHDNDDENESVRWRDA